MMKRILFILCLFVMIFSMAGCSMLQRPRVYDFCCGYSGKKETKFENPDSYVSRFASKTATVEFMGQQYTGEYKRTIYQGCNYHPTLQYKSDDVSFGIKKSGQLCYIYLKNHHETTPLEEHLSKERYIEIATDIAMQYADVSEWNVSLDSHSFNKNGDPNSYTVEFVHYIDGVKTNEVISITLTPSGKIYSLSSRMLGEFTEEDVHGKFDYEKMEKKVIERMKELFQDEADRRNAELTYEVELCLAKERKNKVVLLADASCACPSTGEGHIAAVAFIIR